MCHMSMDCLSYISKAVLSELSNVQSQDFVHIVNAQGNGQQVIQPSDRQFTGLEQVAPDEQSTMACTQCNPYMIT